MANAGKNTNGSQVSERARTYYVFVERRETDTALFYLPLPSLRPHARCDW